ncbi:hypothetical protein DB29_03014 [Shouchella clausii]|nr:hypothetical protein DB29_03014 [Shouchella clausii]
MLLKVIKGTRRGSVLSNRTNFIKTDLTYKKVLPNDAINRATFWDDTS